MKLRVNFLPKKKFKGTLFAKKKNEVTIFAKKCILKFYQVRCKLFAKKKKCFLKFYEFKRTLFGKRQHNWNNTWTHILSFWTIHHSQWKQKQLKTFVDKIWNGLTLVEQTPCWNHINFTDLANLPVHKLSPLAKFIWRWICKLPMLRARWRLDKRRELWFFVFT